MPRILIFLLHSTQISLPELFSIIVVYKMSVTKGQNWVGAEATESAIHIVFLSLHSYCDMVRCLGDRAHFWQLFISFFLNIPIMLYNICY